MNSYKKIYILGRNKYKIYTMKELVDNNNKKYFNFNKENLVSPLINVN